MDSGENLKETNGFGSRDHGDVTVELEAEGEVKPLEKISEFRTVLPQVLAVSTINLILIDLGMVLAFPTIAIPLLLKSTTDLSFTEDQASWFGSIAFICQPLGSSFSGLLFDPVGRKKTMLYVNIPLLIGWLLIYFSPSIAYLYIGGVIMGVGIGFMDAPHITYLGEITQPKWRGILTSFAELCVALGFCFVYFLGTTADWRTISLICCGVPVAAILLITQIPESPIWLISKGRKKEAEKSLRWLRGWVSLDAVQEEFSSLVRHNNSSTQRNLLSDDKTEVFGKGSSQKISFSGKLFRFAKLDCLLDRSVGLPFLLVVIYFAFSHMAGVTSTRPFMVEILNEFGTSYDPNWITAISSVIGILGFIIGMVLLPKAGKRPLSLASMWGCALINGIMFVYGYFFTHLNVPLVMVLLFLLLNFFWSFGIGQIPWMLISEVFPFKGRGVASGIAAALSYVSAFVFTKTYYSTHNSLTLPGVFGFYAVCSFLGGCFLYYCLPETEGNTLEEIETVLENHFNKLRRKPSVITN